MAKAPRAARGSRSRKAGNSSRAADLMSSNGKFSAPPEDVIADYRLAFQSRVAAVTGRKEVLGGRAKFGIFGDGKEIAQIAMAKAFRAGDIRAGYYRDQTFAFATGMSNLREFFSQLYGDPNMEADPASAGRQMTSHFASRFLDDDGRWRRLVDLKNTTADISPTGAQMARLLGLAYASKLYRNLPELADVSGQFSVNGNEVAFGTIGNASTSEGVFLEVMNAAGVLQVPMALSVWDDGYGISVPNEYQTTHSSISKALKGFAYNEKTGSGFDIYVVKGWDYPTLCATYVDAIERVRKEHIPAFFHVIEMTQPQGHSTSGSHERYKSKERLEWEEKSDCITWLRNWILESGLSTEKELDEFEADDRRVVETARKEAWQSLMEPIRREQADALTLMRRVAEESPSEALQSAMTELRDPLTLNRRIIASSLRRSLFALRGHESDAKTELARFSEKYRDEKKELYNSYLFSRSPDSPLEVGEVKPEFSNDSETVDGRVVLLRCFDKMLERDQRVFAIGEDIGKLGDVNLVFEGLNAKYGELRVTDTGIREASILGQGIGASMRGLRPIVDIQYLDYLLFAIQGMSDDLATLHYRSHGGQKAPVIVRTKGHRLEGIWHTGSPMGMILHSCRGIYICVPRNMTQAAGMYNTLLLGDNPALVVEVLSGYRLKERVPNNIGEFTVPLGVPQVLREGADVTIVTYGYCCRVATEAAYDLAAMGIDAEVIDVQTLSPFDLQHTIVSSIEKTNAAVFLDEDVPGGASSYLMQRVLEGQGAWQFLDSAPRTLSASEGRSAYGTDGGYFTKPSREDLLELVYELMKERRPGEFPPLGGSGGGTD